MLERGLVGGPNLDYAIIITLLLYFSHLLDCIVSIEDLFGNIAIEVAPMASPASDLQSNAEYGYLPLDLFILVCISSARVIKTTH
jgi:hypothetical protein